MKKILKKTKKILSWVLITLIILLLVINIPVTLFAGDSSSENYANWMSENLTNDQRVIDIAMLGAHDTFSDSVSLFSKVDKLSASSVMTGFTGILVKGFSVKQSKTQISNITKLLDRGVRYLDVRVKYDAEDNDMYTVHNFYSDNFLKSMEKVAEFLKDNPGEFVIVDIQHVYGLDYQSQADFDKLYAKLQESGIMDYAYPSNIKPLDEVTYGDVTANNTKSGAIILSKFEYNNEFIWNYSSSIRSAWADSDNFDQVLSFLRNEKTLIDSGQALTGNQVSNPTGKINSQDAFRVMQGVVTMQMTAGGIVKGIYTWSLMERAKFFNPYMIKQTDFEQLLSSMPIFMVDYADSIRSNFHENVMKIIIDYDTSS